MEDHGNADCVGCAILSHGTPHGEVFGTDATIQISNLLQPFNDPICKGLAGKPKLFFIQVNKFW